MSSQFIDIAPPPAVEREYPPFEGSWDRTVVLLGASGAGKSSVGRYLSEHAGVEFIDADELVEQRLGLPIAQAVICNADALEAAQTQVTAELLQGVLSDPARKRVVALAASASITDEGRTLLGRVGRAGGLVVELRVDVAEVSRRMGLNAPRAVTLGAPRAMLTKMIAQTHAAHAPVANVSVNTVGRTIASIGREVLESL